ncbi:MAG: haloacid dehalogenase, type II [Rhodospirillales bacterium RIFCSPLOWO2_12_FULL_67_15]|nr:MAG: haloacid dehalogenase, type II [Rhodospirillales bacterium RIFCSPLOWO2_12_FULL_67_15]
MGKVVNPLRGIKACMFDAYGTLFDVAAAAKAAADDLGDKSGPLADIWRTKQLQYTWLRSLMGDYADFWKLTGDALDYALAATGMKGDPALRRKLMELYRNLDSYPDAAACLRTLKQAGFKTAILSNGTPAMLRAAAKSAGLAPLLDHVLSVHSLKIYKPDPRVYRLATKTLKLNPAAICFVSSNAWDAWAGARFGLRSVWINRTGAPPENLPGKIAAEARVLADVPRLLGL